MLEKVCWLSFDPVRCKINYYPRSIALRLEKTKKNLDNFKPASCVLGKDFFNATVHFHPSGSIYQTTPGISLGRAGFKQPGYRSVKRYKLSNDSNFVTLKIKIIRGESRISNDSTYDYIKEEFAENDVIINVDNVDNLDNLDNSNNLDNSDNLDKLDDIDNSNIKILNPQDLLSESLDTNAIIWQWCYGVPEKQGNLISLSDEWWIPYSPEIMTQIENGLQEQKNVTITIPSFEERLICFDNFNSCYAKQYSMDKKKCRMIRRVIKTIEDIKLMYDKISNPPRDINDIIASLPDGSIPHHFICPILQDVMKDPVKTVDGHVYDRLAIERWFQHNTTSPLTGLKLISTTLESYGVLYNQIQQFLNKLTLDI